MGIKRFVLFVTLLGLASMVPGFRDFGPQAAGKMRPIVREATRSDTTAPLRQMPEIPALPELLGDILVKPLKRLPNRPGGGAAAHDPVLQDFLSGVGNPPTDSDFEGVDNVNAVLPPDTIGGIGPNHYVQMVNLAFAIFDRDGNVLFGPVDNSTLWQGFGGLCQRRNDGDPVVLYDHLADRWIMSQFALPRNGPFTQCIAVSKTPDPLGEWHRYEFEISPDKINDYPKFGVWPDGYYMAANQFRCSVFSCSWGGQVVAVFDRDEMLVGGPARMVLFDLETVDITLGGMLPADLDGPAPTPGTPNPFAQIDDDAWGFPQDQLQIWNFAVDWDNPGLSTFGVPDANPAEASAVVATALFDSNLCNYARNCIPHPGGTALDAISDRLMYRLQYRYFADDDNPDNSYQTLVVNHTVNAGDTEEEDHAGVRWYELRDAGSGWAMHQQGTFAPDSNHRWMGSAAMNVHGDIALGYSVAGTITSPSIRFTGRLGTDDLDTAKDGEMTQGEGEIIIGTGAQTHSSGRWGDYSLMAVDPTDDCTFWYTQEYYEVVGVAPWQTRIGSFQLTACDEVDNPPGVSVANPSEGQTVSGTYRVLVSASDDSAVATVELSIDGGGYNNITTNFDGTNYFYDWNTGAEDEGPHTLQARATDDAAQTMDSAVVNVTVDNVNDPPDATFIYVCDGLTCGFDGSDSSDPGGSVVSHAWTFGDGGSGTGATINHTYSAAGTYTVTLTVTDDDGDTDTDSKNDVTVSEPSGAMHVGDLDFTGPSSDGKTWSTEVTVTVHDDTVPHMPLEGIQVSGSWSGSGSGGGSCTTVANGQCMLTRMGIRGKKATYTVDALSGGSLVYDATANHDTDGGSNGTSITVYKP